MFKNKTRARVPSAGTLQVLYQLAYISSGTAVGIAALCAEERRRRTLILQKIADNARRIRQSPRHVHNAALARSEEPADWMYEDLGSQTRNSSADFATGRRVADKPAGREAGLPSAVEQGYDQVVAMNARLSRPSDLPPDESAHDIADEPSNTDHTQLQQHPHFFRTDDIVYREYRRGLGGRLRRIGAMDRQENVRFAMARSQPEFRTLKTLNGDLSDLASHVKFDVQLFLRSQPWGRRGWRQEARVADHLLAKALECGSLTDSRSIYDWKLRHGALSQQDLRQICDSCSHLAAHQDREAVLTFFTDLLATESFFAAPERLRYQLTFGLMAEALKWELPLTNRDIIHALLGNRRRVDLDALYDALDTAVRDLLADGHVDAAADVIVNVSKADHRLAVPLADLVFHDARQEGRLVICRKILNWRAAHFQRQENSIDQYEWFIRMCDEQKVYQMLNRTLHSMGRPGQFKWLVPKLSPEARLVLATACTVQPVFPHDTFRKLYEEIPKTVNQPLRKIHSALQLETIWNTTRDLKAVISLFEELRHNSTLLDEEGSSILVKMVEILSSAHQPDRALKLLQELGSSRVERAELACLAAEAMAKKKAWTDVGRLLNAVAGMDGSASHIATSHPLNRIAHIFCQQHGPQESWRYIKSLMRRFNFQPAKSTVRRLLQCFVAHKSLEMIPISLRHLQSCGVNIRVDTELAAFLLSIYAWLQRPTHVLMMELCRNLIAIAPWLDRTKLTGVIEEAIASDLRGASRKNRDKVQSWARENLGRTREMEGSGLPSPAWSYDAKVLTKKFSDIVIPEAWSSLNDRPLSFTGSGQNPLDSADSAQEAANGGGFPGSGEDHSRRRRAEQEMILAFSCDNHVKVLQLYRQYLDPKGLPLSPIALEIATESALRRCQGDDSDALALLRDAQAAGMNTSCAMGPLLIHQIRRLANASEQDANRLRTAVIDYYRMNDGNGWKVRHHVGVSAADVLARTRRPSLAINLLNAIYYSEWVVDRPLDIVAMTVYVKSYAALRSIRGVSWAVQKVLHSKMRIDSKFTKALKDSLRHFGHKQDGQSGTETAECMYIRQLRAECLRVEREQARMAKTFGIELVKRMAECSLPRQGQTRGLDIKGCEPTAQPFS